MIEIKLSFSSMAEAATFFQNQFVPTSQAVLPFASAAAAPVAEEDFSVDPTPTAAPVAAPAAAKEKKTRKTKEQPVVEESAAGEPKPESPTYTIEDVRNALADMIAKTNFETGTSLVREFKTADGANAARLSELREADWAEFITASKKVAVPA